MVFKANTNYTDDTHNEPKRFEMCYVDADTILHQAAAALQQSYINVTHKGSGNVKRFTNKTAFGVRAGKIVEWNPDKDTLHQGVAATKWLGHQNYVRSLKDQRPFTLDDFEIEEMSELKPEYSNIEDALDYGLSSIGFVVGGIKKYADSDDYKLIISGGNGNYRKGEAKTLKYKGNRSDKPILYLELREAMVAQYKQRMMFADNCEAEDLCGWYAKEEEKRVGEDFGNWKVCISYIDKDVDHVYAPSINYSKFDEGFRFPTKLECTKCLVTQIVCGDTACDNIQGLPNLTKDVTSKYGMRAASGCGKQTAMNLLEHADTEKEMYERAVFAYQSYYGMEPVTFDDWEGNELWWTWLDFMQETSILVKMQDFEGEMFSVAEKLNELDIDFTKELYKVAEPELNEDSVVLDLLDKLAKDLTEITDNCKPKKSEKKDLQVARLEYTFDKLNELQSNLINFYKEN